MRNTIFISRISSNWLRKWSFRADRCWQKFIFSILSINKLIPWTASFYNNRRNWKCIRVISNRWISISHSQWQVSSTAKKTIVAAMKNSSEVNCFSFSTVEHFSKKRPPLPKWIDTFFWYRTSPYEFITIARLDMKKEDIYYQFILLPKICHLTPADVYLRRARESFDSTDGIACWIMQSGCFGPSPIDSWHIGIINKGLCHFTYLYAISRVISNFEGIVVPH